MKTLSMTGSLSRNAGGLFESVRQLNRALADFPSLNVTVLGVRDEFTGADLSRWNPLRVKVFNVHGPQQFGYAPGMRQSLMEMDVDVLHTHGIWMYSSLVSLEWYRKYRRPYVISPHGMVDPWAMAHLRWKKRLALLCYERRHLAQAQCLRALCIPEAEAIRALGLRNPICIVPNGIDMPSPVRPSSEPISNGRKVLLYLGRVHPKKGLVNLLKAWASIRRSGADSSRHASEEWLLVIAGWEQVGHEAELKTLATHLGLTWCDLRDREVTAQKRDSASVVFISPQFAEAKAASYANCDAFILPSFSEGLPMTVLEAWSYGKPVLMTSACNLPEGFSAEAAIRIEPTVEGVTRGLNALLSLSPGMIADLGNNGRKLVMERFTWRQVAAQMKSVYDWLASGEPKPDCVQNSLVSCNV